MASEEPLTGMREHQKLNPDDQLLTDYELFEKYFDEPCKWGDLWIDVRALATAVSIKSIFTYSIPYISRANPSDLLEAEMLSVIRYLAGSVDFHPPGQWA